MTDIRPLSPTSKLMEMLLNPGPELPRMALSTVTSSMMTGACPSGVRRVTSTLTSSPVESSTPDWTPFNKESSRASFGSSLLRVITPSFSFDTPVIGNLRNRLRLAVDFDSAFPPLSLLSVGGLKILRIMLVSTAYWRKI